MYKLASKVYLKFHAGREYLRSPIFLKKNLFSSCRGHDNMADKRRRRRERNYATEEENYVGMSMVSWMDRL